MRRALLPALLLLAFLAGCAATPPAPVSEPSAPVPPAPSSEPPGTPAPPVVEPGPVPLPPPPPAAAEPRPPSIAVARLMDTAKADMAENRLGAAAATLERALRLEPRNARLWHELARVRLRQGEYAQAASLAARSNTWAGSDAELRAANQRLIEDARARTTR